MATGILQALPEEPVSWAALEILFRDWWFDEPVRWAVYDAYSPQPDLLWDHLKRFADEARAVGARVPAMTAEEEAKWKEYCNWFAQTHAARPDHRDPEDLPMEIRPAGAGDLDAVADLWVEMLDFHHGLDARFWRRAPDGREKFRAWMELALADPDRAVFVAGGAGRIVGFTHGQLKASPPPVVPRKGGFITDLAVAAAHWRLGVGRRLLGAVEDWCRERGAEEVTLTAAVRNEPAVGFWRAMGYEPWTFTMWKPLGPGWG